MNLDYKKREEQSLDDFRGMLGVPEGRLARFINLNRKAIRPGLEEITAPADFTLQVKPTKSGRQVTHVVISWELKNEEDRAEAFNELLRPRLGRRARIRGEVERVDVENPANYSWAA